MTRHQQDLIQRVLDAARDGKDWATVAKNNGANAMTAWGSVDAARKCGDWTVKAPQTGGFRYRKVMESMSSI